MNAFQALLVLAYGLLRDTGENLTLKTVQCWIDDHSQLQENWGSGYSGSRLRSGPGNGFTEIVKRPKSNNRFEITASVYFDPRQGAIASKTWEAKKLDTGLEKFFGKNQRVRIKI